MRINLPGCIYNNIINSKGLVNLFWRAMRRIFIKIYPNTPCRMLIHGKIMAMPFDHALPMYLNDLPFYDQLPSRISQYIGARLKIVNCIDVGANIGDTIAAFKKSRNGALDDFYVAIEPNPYYSNYLKINWTDREAMFLPFLCGSSEMEGFVNFKDSNGTASSFFDESFTSKGQIAKKLQ